MRTHVLFLLVTIAFLGLVSSGFGGAHPKESPGAHTALIGEDSPTTYNITICCCGDTCKEYELSFAELVMDGTSSADSIWLNHMPKNLRFKNMSMHPAKEQRIAMPGMKYERKRGMKDGMKEEMKEGMKEGMKDGMKK